MCVWSTVSAKSLLTAAGSHRVRRCQLNKCIIIWRLSGSSLVWSCTVRLKDKLLRPESSRHKKNCEDIQQTTVYTSGAVTLDCTGLHPCHECAWTCSFMSVRCFNVCLIKHMWICVSVSSSSSQLFSGGIPAHLAACFGLEWRVHAIQQWWGGWEKEKTEGKMDKIKGKWEVIESFKRRKDDGFNLNKWD